MLIWYVSKKFCFKLFICLGFWHYDESCQVMGNWTNQSLILSQRSKYCQVALTEDQSKLKIVHIESRSVGWGRPSTLSLWEAKIISVWSRSRPGPQWKRTDFETDLPKHRFCQRQTSLWISCENLIANRLVYSLIMSQSNWRRNE